MTPLTRYSLLKCDVFDGALLCVTHPYSNLRFFILIFSNNFLMLLQQDGKILAGCGSRKSYST